MSDDADFPPMHPAYKAVLRQVTAAGQDAILSTVALGQHVLAIAGRPDDERASLVVNGCASVILSIAVNVTDDVEARRRLVREVANALTLFARSDALDPANDAEATFTAMRADTGETGPTETLQ